MEFQSAVCVIMIIIATYQLQLVVAAKIRHLKLNYVQTSLGKKAAVARVLSDYSSLYTDPERSIAEPPSHDLPIFRKRRRRAISDSVNRLWPNGVIPYEISHEFSSNVRLTIDAAIKELQELTCLRFVAKQDGQIHLSFLVDQNQTCGYDSAQRVVALGIGNSCEEKGTVLHEILHAVGLAHEHQRPDRDDFVTINWDNIDQGKRDQYSIRTDALVGDTTYCYNTIMGYGANGFVETSSHRPAITSLADLDRYGGLIWQRRGLTDCDVELVNQAYDCVDKNSAFD